MRLSSFSFLFGRKEKQKEAKRKEKPDENNNFKGTVFPFLLYVEKPRVDKGPQPLIFNPALTTCASERMKTHGFSYFAGFAARERMREAKPVKAQKSGVQPLF